MILRKNMPFFQKLFSILIIYLILLGTSLVIPVQAQLDVKPDLPGGAIVPNLTREGVYDILVTIAQYAIFIIPGIALLFIIWGAVQLAMGKSESGWATIKNALIGLAIAALSFLVIGLITGLIDAIYSGELIPF